MASLPSNIVCTEPHTIRLKIAKGISMAQAPFQQGRQREESPDKIVSETIKENVKKLKFGEEIIPADLFDSVAKSVADELNKAKDKFNKPTQIRRFYDELVGWQQRIKGDNDDERKAEFEKYNAFIRMMNAKVAYAKGRELVDANFEYWFTAANKATTSAKALDHFRLHFEAVLGFLKGMRN